MPLLGRGEHLVAELARRLPLPGVHELLHMRDLHPEQPRVLGRHEPHRRTGEGQPVDG